MNWYILFVRAGQEQKVVLLLKKWLNTEIFKPFIPLQQMLFKSSGSVKKGLKPLFPSYVFIKSEVSDREFVKCINTFVHASRDIIRILSYSDNEIAMRQSEKSLLLRLCNDDHYIEISSGIKEGNRIHITDGPLKGWESIVRKINRHKKQAWIEVEFMGDIRLVSVALEIVEKVSDGFEYSYL